MDILRQNDLREQLDALPALVERAWQKPLGHPFMLELREGRLSRERLRGFLRSWHRCLIEDNAGIAGVYYKHQSVIKIDVELEDWLTVRIGRTLTRPSLGGAPRVIRRIGAPLGISEEDFLKPVMNPEAFGYQGWLVKIYQEAPLAELLAFFFGEDTRKALLDPVMARALTEHYGSDREAARALSEESKPEESLRFLKQFIQNGEPFFRPGWGATYAATIQAGMFSLLLDGLMS